MIEYKSDNLNFITKNESLFKGPFLFFLFVVIVSGALFLFNLKISSDIKDLGVKIEEREKDILVLKNNPKIQIFSLLESNKNIISTLEKRSEVTKYINHVNAISKKYDVEFSGFNMSNGKISVQSLSQSSEKGTSFKKINNFISSYKQDDLALLDLEFIQNFEGMDSIKFNINFLVK